LKLPVATHTQSITNNVRRHYKFDLRATRSPWACSWAHGRNFVVKCEGTAWCETNIVIGSMQK